MFTIPTGDNQQRFVADVESTHLFSNVGINLVLLDLPVRLYGYGFVENSKHTTSIILSFFFAYRANSSCTVLK